MTRAYLGIDCGTQGLSILCVNESHEVIATGEATYGFVKGLGAGCYEQNVDDWESAMESSMQQIHKKIPDLDVLAIGFSGQMHGEVLMDEHGQVLKPVRLWCDARNDDEGAELTKSFNFKCPKRMTSARFLWTCRNLPDIAEKTRHMTTPAGWMSYRLTGEHNLGIGDASGVFPVRRESSDYDAGLLQKYDQIVEASCTRKRNILPLKEILPKVLLAGLPAGYTNESGAKLLGIKKGIAVAPAEGDQVAALAGSLIGKAGTVSLSFGTSVCANSVGDRQFQGVSPSVDHFCAADGKPINMVWLRNGTTFMNTIVSSYGGTAANNGDNDNESNAFAAVMPQLVKAPADCGGLLALPFMEDEPGVNVTKGGSAMIIGWNSNSNPGNVAKAALLSTCFNLRKGSEILDEQGYPRTELILTGGLAKTPECGQVLADVFNSPVSLFTGSSDEGSSFGASLMASFMHRKIDKILKEEDNWEDFLHSLQRSGSSRRRFEPIPSNVKTTNQMYARYKNLLALVPELTKAVSC